MKTAIALMAAMLAFALPARAQSIIEVTGSATLSIVPDRITIEIGMEEYYKHSARGDSAIVGLADIEKGVRQTLSLAGVPDSLIIVSDFGNYRNRNVSSTLLMAKSLWATVEEFGQIERIADSLDRRGISWINITKTSNSDMARYNRQGLRDALDAARQKAEFIAQNEGLTIIAPQEIVETTSEPAARSMLSNVAYDDGAGMENMRRIVRRYSVKARYLFKTKN